MARFFTLVGIVLLTLVMLGSSFFGLVNGAAATPPALDAAELHVCLSGCLYSSIQDAVDAANDGDVIKVAAGTYTDISTRDDVTQVLYISKTLTVRGGYTTADWTAPDPAANPTILDAQGRGRVLYITGNISPTIEGLQITGGNAAGLRGHDIDWTPAGAGGYIITATVHISHNWILNNNAGGGLYLANSVGTLVGNIVTSNTDEGLHFYYSPVTLTGNVVASTTGTGLILYYSPATLNKNLIASNVSNWHGGGLHFEYSPARLNGNIVVSNSALLGGGLYSYQNDTALSDNTFAFNTASGEGGGLFLRDSYTTFAGNVVVSNTAQSIGGGLCLRDSYAAFFNNVIANNQVVTDGHGSGLYFHGSRASLLHTTIVRNQGGSGIYLTGYTIEWPKDRPTYGASGNGTDVSKYADSPSIDCDAHPSFAIFRNTILTGHQSGLEVEDNTINEWCIAHNIAELKGTLWANDTNWSGNGTISLTLNVYGDPSFVNPTTGDFHIGPNSAARDVGVNAGVYVDMDHQPRPYLLFDLGADEYWPPGTPKYIFLPLLRRN